MEPITLIIGIIAVASWTLGLAFVYVCAGTLVWGLIQQLAGR